MKEDEGKVILTMPQKNIGKILQNAILQNFANFLIASF